MKKVAIFLLASLLVFSCSSNDRNYLERYVKAFEAYARADFSSPSLAAAFEDATRFYPSCLLKGKTEYFSGNPVASAKTFRTALSLQKTSVDARIWLARSLLETSQLDTSQEALALLFQAVQADSDSVAAHSLLARYFRDNHDESSQKDHLERIIAMSSSVAAAYLERAKLFWKQGNDEGALADIDKALALFDPDTEYARVAGEIKRRITAYKDAKK